PKDIEFAVGWEAFFAAIEDGRVQQNRRLSGTVGDAVLIDLCGWAGKDSLKVLAQSLGIPMPDKTLMDAYKSNMRQGLLEHPVEFLRYALDDAAVLLKIHKRFIRSFRRVQGTVLGMSPRHLWREEDIPLTLGTLVAKTFARWLQEQFGEQSKE